MTLLERNRGILARIEDLSPITEELRGLFTEGKRDHLRRGTSAEGGPFARLAPSTLARPRQTSTPFLPRGEASSIMTTYTVQVTVQPGQLVISAGWPLDWIRYHVEGGRRLPRRDPTGFRRQDVDKAMELFRRRVMGNG